MSDHYRSTSYRPEDVVKRYVRAIGGRKFRIYEVDSYNKTIREYDVPRSEVPEDKAREAELRRGCYPSGVRL